MSNKKVRVAVIGSGAIAKSAHIPVYLKNENATLVALVDVDKKKAERLSKKFGVKKVFTSVDELFETEEIDAVSVCTPPDTHADIVVNALNHGVDVLCEKPLATDVESGKRMLKAAKDNGKLLMVGFHRRFLPNYQRVKQAILDGRVGHVYCAVDRFLEPNPLYAWCKSKWFFEQGRGGAMLDVGPHVIDMLNYVFDDFPRAVSVVSSSYFESPVEDSCTLLLEYSKGRIGVGLISWLSSTVIESLDVYGTAQTLFVSPTQFLAENSQDIPEISRWRAATESLVSMKFPDLPMIRVRRVNPYRLEIAHFVNQVKNNVKSYANALNALSVLTTCDMAIKAKEKKCRMEIPKIEMP